MRFFATLIIFFLLNSTIIYCRPAQIEEENDSETNEGVYESDDSADDEDLRDDDQTAEDEVSQRKTIQNDGFEETEGQEIIHNPRVLPNKYFGFNREKIETVAENESDFGRNSRDNPVTDSRNNRKEMYNVEKDIPKNYAADVVTTQVERGLESRNLLESRSMNEKSPNFASEVLFQLNNDDTSADNVDLENQATNTDRQHIIRKQCDKNGIFENRFIKNNEYSYNIDRNRREIKGLEENHVVDNSNAQNENINSENSILQNIKKLSEQDLEELLNSLPENKKALLRRIINKRDTTKKAGAVGETNYLDQADNSKLEGSLSVSSLLPVMESIEISKHDDGNDGTSTKILYSESDSAKSTIKSIDSGDTSTITDTNNITLKDEAILTSNNKETLKNENKGEINNQSGKNDNSISDFSKCNDNGDKSMKYYSNENEFLDNANFNEKLKPQKRDVSEEDSLQLSESLKKLEESFPKAYEDTDSDEAPLIRVKRTGMNHRIKKRDLTYLPSNTKSLEDENSENMEASEFDSKGFLENESRYAKNDNHEFFRNIFKIKKHLEDSKTDSIPFTIKVPGGQLQKAISEKVSLGSDTDCVLSGIKVVDDNIMLNDGIRNKRKLLVSENVDLNTMNVTTELNKEHRSCSQHDINSIHNNCDTSQYIVDTIFGSLSRDSENNVGRYKRIKRNR